MSKCKTFLRNFQLHIVRVRLKLYFICQSLTVTNTINVRLNIVVVHKFNVVFLPSFFAVDRNQIDSRKMFDFIES